MNWHELQHDDPARIVDWAAAQSWCHAMQSCLQDAQWHSEGDVWTHTKMVVQAATELAEWPSLTPTDKQVLLWTAIFHDAAKPLTTVVDPESGRITSPKHAVKGEQLARSVLRKLECPLAIREHIARMVRYHSRPMFLAERDEPIQEVVRMSWLVQNRLLYLFAVADTRGRDTESMDRPEENLAYWQLLCEENQCYEHPYPFPSNHARFTYGRQRNPNLHYVPHEQFSCSVTMMAGLPGSGKNTWLARHREGWPVVSLDHIRRAMGVQPNEDQGRVIQVAQKQCRQLLRDKVSFCVNATNLLRATRKRWIDLFADYGAQIKLVYLEPPMATIRRQNRDRSDAVPTRVVEKLAQRCEPPTDWECHRVHLLESAMVAAERPESSP